MTFDTFVSHYGVLGIFLGSGVEGEAVVLTGGVLAHRGLVPLWAAMLAAATGSCLVDQLWFLLGRHCRHYAWVQRQFDRSAARRAVGFLERHPNAFIFGFRFIYGMRTVSPIVIGASRVPTARFMILNAIAAAIWGPLFIWIGFAFGHAIDPLLHHLQHGLVIAAAALVVLAAVAGAGFYLRRRR